MMNRTWMIGVFAVVACGGKDAANNKPTEPAQPAQQAAGKVVVIDEIDPKVPVDRPYHATITVPENATATMTTMSSKDPDSIPHFARFETESWSIDVDHIGSTFKETAESILSVTPPEKIVDHATTPDGGWVVVASPAIDDPSKLALNAVHLVHTQLALHCHATIYRHDQPAVDSALAACKSIAAR